MVVESADRLGLAQLHQLRGRVGRGRDAGRCWLIEGPSPTPDGRARLRAVAQLADGFALAAHDLATRGPGQRMGHAQSGAESVWAAATQAPDLLAALQRAARGQVGRDGTLSGPESLALSARRTLEVRSALGA